MNSKDKNLIKKAIQKNNKVSSKYFYPLLDSAFSNEDLICGIKVLVSGQITISKKTRDIDKNAAAFILQGAIDYLNN